MSTIGSVSGSSMAMMQGVQRRERPDTAKMAEQLFARIDSSGQGYIQKSDLQSSLASSDSSASSGTTSSIADELFAKLDGDSDGKVTQQEFSSGLQQLADEFEQAFQGGRMQGAMPPPPPPANDAGFTEDELKSQLSEIGNSDSQRSSLISSVLENFSAADTNSDGKVSFEEAMNYQKSTEGSASSESTSASSGAASSASGDNDLKLMQQIMRLMQAYGLNGDSSGNTTAASLSVSA